MLTNNNGFASWSSNDIEQSRKFYGEVLGLNLKEQMGGIELQLANQATGFIYPKPDHIPATFTVYNFLVDDIDKEVEELSGKGVVFEQYSNGPVSTDEKGIARGDGINGPTMAWFKDPAGNYLSLIQK